MTTAGDIGSGTGSEPMVRYIKKIKKRKIIGFKDFIAKNEGKK